MGLAQELERDSEGVIVAWMIVGNLRRLSQKYGFAVVKAAIEWLPDHFIPGDGARDTGAVFNRSLERLVQAFLAARKEVAEELGEDSSHVRPVRPPGPGGGARGARG